MYAGCTCCLVRGVLCACVHDDSTHKHLLYLCKTVRCLSLCLNTRRTTRLDWLLSLLSTLVAPNKSGLRTVSTASTYIYTRVVYGNRYPSVHGAVFRNRKSYGPVRCGFKKAEILRCGSVRFSDMVNPKVRCGAVIYPTVWFGAVFRNQESYGVVWCGFQTS